VQTRSDWQVQQISAYDFINAVPSGTGAFGSDSKEVISTWIPTMISSPSSAVIIELKLTPRGQMLSSRRTTCGSEDFPQPTGADASAYAFAQVDLPLSTS
jgi:hypothetical protein